MRTRKDPAELVGGLIAWVIDVWLAMLFVGAAHATDPRIPALGLAAVAWLGAALSLFVGLGRRSRKAKKSA